MSDYFYPAGSAGCTMKYLDFEICSLGKGESFEDVTGGKETSLTILCGSCLIYVDGVVCETGVRDSGFTGASPHTAFLPAGCSYKVSAKTPVTFSIAKTAAAGDLNDATHVEVGAIKSFKRGTGQTLREIYELTPPYVPAKLLVYEIITPGGNWSSFPPHKHDIEEGEEALLQEVYYFTFDPPEGFALFWLSDDKGALNKAFSVRNGDFVAIPNGYHTMCASPGYTCSTHCVMAGPGKEWKFRVKPEYKHLLDWIH